MSDPVRCAYVTSRYPAVTHTFVTREVHALRRRGVDIRTVSVRRQTGGEVLGMLALSEDAGTFALRPIGPLRLLAAHLGAVRRSPYLRCFIETLRDAAGGPRALLWQVFYFAQAVVLWDWMCSNGLRHVHAHHANVAADVAMIAARLGGPGWTWSFTLHGPTELGDPVGHKLGVKAGRADAVVAISEYARSQVCRYAPDANVHVIHCGLDLADYEFASRRTAPAGEPLHILNVAQLQERKGQLLLVEAVARLDFPARLTVVGAGPMRAVLEERAGALGIDARFVGAVPQEAVKGFYRDADVFCLPSSAEGVPIVLMEAMASGVPVVATRIAGVPELVEHGVTGLLVPPGDVDAITDALRALASDPDLAGRLAAAGRRKVEDEFDVQTVAAELEQVFERIRRRR